MGGVTDVALSGPGPMNFDNIPSLDVILDLQVAGADKDTMQAVVDLVDAILNSLCTELSAS